MRKLAKSGKNGRFRNNIKYCEGMIEKRDNLGVIDEALTTGSSMTGIIE
jgi:hypothetical protein